MTRLIFFLTFLSQIFLVSGQNFLQEGTLSEILHHQVAQYAVLDTATGDLNRDKYLDLVVIYRHINEHELSSVIVRPEPRPLLLYTGQGNGIYKLAAKNDKVVYCFDCGGIWGDPFQAVVIKDGFFTVEHYAGSNWRWTRYITFRYSADDSQWYLHRDGGTSFHVAEPHKKTEHMRTIKDFGKVSFTEFDVYDKR